MSEVVATVTTPPSDTKAMRVISVVVSSIDGYITKHEDGGTTHWASPEDQKHFYALMASCDVSIMGGETYRSSRPYILSSLAASTRRRVVWTRDPAQHAGDAVDGKLEFSSAPLASIVDDLRADGHERCCVLGGGNVYGALMAENLIDELVLTLEPLVFGTGVRHTGLDHRIDTRFTLASVDRLNADTLLLTYQRATPEHGPTAD